MNMCQQPSGAAIVDSDMVQAKPTPPVQLLVDVFFVMSPHMSLKLNIL